jgi:hypothetical protein
LAVNQLIDGLIRHKFDLSTVSTGMIRQVLAETREKLEGNRHLTPDTQD